MPLKTFFEKLKHHVSQAKKQTAVSYAPARKMPAGPKSQLVEFSLSNVAKAAFTVLLVLFLAYLFYEIRDIVIVFFVALLFAAALDPTVDKWQARKVPRWVSIIVIYLLVFVLLGVFISNFIPLIASQLTDLAIKLQDMIRNLANGGSRTGGIFDWLSEYFRTFFSEVNQDVLLSQLQNSLATLGDALKGAAGNVFKALIAVSNGVFNFLLVLVLTFFMVVDESGIDEFILSLFPARYAAYIAEKSQAVKEKVGHWLRAQLLLGLSIGVLSFIGFLILDVKYGATLAIFAGLTEVIPYVGPFLAWAASMPIVMNQSPWLGLWVTVMFLIIQRLENDILVPLIMKHATGLSPILIIFAMMVGFQFMGIVGLILSIPVASTIAIFVHDYRIRKK